MLLGVPRCFVGVTSFRHVPRNSKLWQRFQNASAALEQRRGFWAKDWIWSSIEDWAWSVWKVDWVDDTCISLCKEIQFVEKHTLLVYAFEQPQKLHGSSLIWHWGSSSTQVQLLDGNPETGHVRTSQPACEGGNSCLIKGWVVGRRDVIKKYD